MHGAIWDVRVRAVSNRGWAVNAKSAMLNWRLFPHLCRVKEPESAHWSGSGWMFLVPSSLCKSWSRIHTYNKLTKYQTVTYTTHPTTHRRTLGAYLHAQSGPPAALDKAHVRSPPIRWSSFPDRDACSRRCADGLVTLGRRGGFFSIGWRQLGKDVESVRPS
ncbi:hypothetical protein LZ31DRAFT_265523 [Colletotrichum somersetense]|nr:hypothetical protein LZ31DRAFT_265523 [Colletotrichum somersetense]